MDPYTHSNNTFIDSNTNSDLSAFFRQGPYQSSTRTFPQPEITWATHSRAINRVDSLWSVVMAWFYDSRHVGNVNKPPLAIDFLTSRRDASVVHFCLVCWELRPNAGFRDQTPKMGQNNLRRVFFVVVVVVLYGFVVVANVAFRNVFIRKSYENFSFFNSRSARNLQKNLHSFRIK